MFNNKFNGLQEQQIEALVSQHVVCSQYMKSDSDKSFNSISNDSDFNG